MTLYSVGSEPELPPTPPSQSLGLLKPELTNLPLCPWSLFLLVSIKLCLAAAHVRSQYLAAY